MLRLPKSTRTLAIHHLCALQVVKQVVPLREKVRVILRRAPWMGYNIATMTAMLLGRTTFEIFFVGALSMSTVFMAAFYIVVLATAARLCGLLPRR